MTRSVWVCVCVCAGAQFIGALPLSHQLNVIYTMVNINKECLIKDAREYSNSKKPAETKIMD